MLEKYAVLLGGGVNHRYGLDDGICIKLNHAAIAGGLGPAVESAREKIGHLHRIAAEVSTSSEIKEAVEGGAGVLVLNGVESSAVRDRIAYARELSPSITIEISGINSVDEVRAFAEAGADLIRVDALTQSVRAMDISFQIQPG